MHVYTYHNLRLRVARPHRAHKRREGLDDIRHRLTLLHDIISPQMHRNHIRGIRLQPPLQLLLLHDINGQEPRVALIVAVVLRVFAVVLGFARPDKVYSRPLGGLEFLPEFGAPADNLRDGVAEGHVAEGDGRVLGEGSGGEGRQGEQLEGDHFGDEGWGNDVRLVVA